MEERVSLWQGIRPLVGTVVGVGFFGLPYVFAQGGYFLVLGELIVLAAVQLVFLYAYTDLVLAKKGHARFLHVIGDAFGPLGRAMAFFTFFGSLWGAMIAYLLAGGDFLSYILKAWIPGVESHTLSIFLGVFFFLGLLGGSFVVPRVQRYLIPFFFVTLLVLSSFSFPFVSFDHLTSFSLSYAIPSLGVLLFALSGVSAIPEMRDALKGNGKKLRRAIFWGMLLVVAVYALFTAVVVGITGSGTPPQAIAAFAGIAPWMVLLGSILGITTITTAYINIGSALVHTLLYDVRLRFLPAILLVGGVPLFLVVFGVSNMIGVLQYTGGILGSLLSILVLLAYEKARRTHQLPVHARALSPFLIFSIFAIFFVMLVFTLRS